MTQAPEAESRKRITLLHGLDGCEAFVEQGTTGLSIDCGGSVITRSLKDWHALAAAPHTAAPAADRAVSELSDDRLLHLWDTHVGEPTDSLPLKDCDKLHFARAAIVADRALARSTDAPSEPVANALSHEEIAAAGLGLEYVHSVLCWAACGYVHTPERIANLHTAYRIVDRLVNATPQAAATSTPCASGEGERLARGESHPVIEALRALPAYRHNEIDGEESDGTPRYWRNRPFVSLRSVERIVLEALKGSAQ